MFPVKDFVISATVKIPILYAFKNFLSFQEFLERRIIIWTSKGLEDVGAHWSLGALDLGPDIVSESEVFLRIGNTTGDLQIWLCRKHRFDDHMFDRFGYRSSVKYPRSA